MPVYEYVCPQCSLHFSRRRPITEYQSSAECPECQIPVAKTPSAANHTFAHVPTGPVPQNTGVHAIDHNVDRVIGRDAQQKWEAIQLRQRDKREILRNNPGSTGFDLSRTADGSYRIMKPEERRAAETARSIHDQATKMLEGKTKPT